MARQVYEGLRLMSAAKKGKVGRIRARGLDAEGLPPGVLSILNDLATELDQADPETNDEGSFSGNTGSFWCPALVAEQGPGRDH
ncbi:hypothetical protein [Streptomyces cavernicola]|uniref:Resolvase/invertase-type recombinase catalytic domain-containing protein n=1 Tax=Streptomyces cavernicola TaxID=3043613 RepID=A0ABT6SEC1_9ACTN|nr:hypothetical protein [Streptomyces sp. B-S-A6]MDI3406284.1 hypothetical protein [Streptomyces sp. B-S-A6]